MINSERGKMRKIQKKKPFSGAEMLDHAFDGFVKGIKGKGGLNVGSQLPGP